MMHKTKTYLKNYWSLYGEFVREFIELKYQDIPLALMVNFYRLLDKKLVLEMDNIRFEKYLKHVIEKKEIQPTFDEFLQPIYQFEERINKEGALLVNHRYLKFNGDLFNHCFDKENTIIFNERECSQKIFGFTTHSRQGYREDISQITEKLIHDAKRLFSKRTKHRVFNNKFFYDEFIRLIPEMVDMISSIENYFNNNKISCIVVGTTEDIISRTIAVVGAKHGVPSICLQHGLITGEEAYMPIFANKFAIYGHYDEDLLMAMGAKKEQLVVIGHPRFDEVYTRAHCSRQELCEKYDLDPSKKIILIATQPFNPTYWDAFIKGILKEQDFNIIIKPHPYELTKKQYSHYQELAEEHSGIKVMIEVKTNLYDLISNADLGLVYCSTVGLEIMMFNKPLCVLKDDCYDFYEGLGDMLFYDVEPLIAYVARIFSSNQTYSNALENTKRFLDYVYPQKMSCEKLAILIQDMTSQ